MRYVFLLLFSSSLAAQKTPDIQKLRDAVAQLEQEIQLTGTQDLVKEKEESSFWPKCKFWMGLAAVSVLGQFVSYALQDKNQSRHLREQQERIDRLSVLVEQYGARLTAVEGHGDEITIQPAASSDNSDNKDEKS